MPFMFRQLREDIDSVFARDPAARSSWEVLTCYPGLHAVWIHRIAHWFWMQGLTWLGRFASHLGRWRGPVLELLKIRNLFDAVVTSEMVQNQKPAPDIFLEAARRISVQPQFCRAYEDTDLGMQAIRAAGMEAVDVRELLVKR